MSINFTTIFQDSWNFVRNKQQLTLTFSLAFLLTSLCFDFLIIPNLAPPLNTESDELANALGMKGVGTDFVMYSFIYQLAIFIISHWCLVAIHQISQGQMFNLGGSFTFLLRRLIGVLLINIILLVPVVIGVSDVLFSLLSNRQPSIISAISLALGLYLYVRFCLAGVHYLVTQNNFNQTLKATWYAGIKRGLLLFVYCLFVYILLPFLFRNLSALGNHFILNIIVSALMSFITVFSLVFTYRFYSVFMQKRAN